MQALQEPFEILWINARRNAVSEIRNPPFGRASFTKGRAHATHATLDSLASTVQQCRIQVPLPRLVWRHYTKVRRRDAPVEAEHVVAGGGCCCEGGRCVGTLSEKDERDCRETVLSESCVDGRGDVFEWRERELREIIWGQLSRPRVENLQ